MIHTEASGKRVQILLIPCILSISPKIQVQKLMDHFDQTSSSELASCTHVYTRMYTPRIYLFLSLSTSHIFSRNQYIPPSSGSEANLTKEGKRERSFLVAPDLGGLPPLSHHDQARKRVAGGSMKVFARSTQL